MKTKLLTLFVALICASSIFASDTQVDGIWYDFDSSTQTASVTYRGGYHIDFGGKDNFCAVGDTVEIIGNLKKYGEKMEIEGKGKVVAKGQVVVDTIAVTPSEAYEIGMALENNATSKEVYVVTGYVDSIASEYSEIYGFMSFFMCDDLANPTYDFEAYRITVPADNQPKVGDKVKVTGNIHHYYKAATEEKTGLHIIEIEKGDYEFVSHIPSYTITLYTDMTKGTISGAGKYFKGATCTLTATANYGYHFTQWNDGNTENPRKIIVTQDTTFTAEFAKNIYTISVEAEHGSVAGGGDYEYLSTVQLTATADEHYHFTQWSDWNTNNPRQITVVEDKTYTAIFSIDQHTISASAEHGTVNGVGTYNYSTNVTLTAIPNLGYEFSNWADGNTDNPRIIELTQDTTLEAIFDYQLTGKCGKDNALTWTLDKSTMALNITGTGALSENYTYGTFIESLTINNEITSIGQDAFYGCKNLKKVIIGSSVKVLEEYAFYGCSAIESITCYSQRPPTVNNKALYDLDYGTIVYVPADYLNTYKMHDAWGLYDVRPIGAKNVETTEVTTSTTSNDVTITWPITDGTDSYTLTITKGGETVCVLTFNANGQLTNIAFAAPGHNGARQAPAATLTAQGYQFTVTGLNPGTAYNYSVTATDAGGQTLAEHKGNFSTTGGESSLESVHGTQSTMHKVLRNGQILLERNNATYTPMGQKVK